MSTSSAASSSRPNVIQPSRPDPTKHIKRSAPNSILVSPVQKGNPLLQFIKTVPWEYGDILGDYQVGLTTGVLYLSLRYHLLHPTYIHSRFQKLGQAYNLRILLVQCDVTDHQAPIRELTKLAIINNYTLMISWSNVESANILTLYKSLASTPPTSIKTPAPKDFQSQVGAVLMNAKGVNKTDVVALLNRFKSLNGIAQASAVEENLLECPGIGEKKARRLKDLFEEPFYVGGHKKRRVEKNAEEGNVLN
ncbi:DNA repair protein rad10 [Atractiella rhizophila]|nr:DNA repair protein rad10 [Atractiella rhizophila]